MLIFNKIKMKKFKKGKSVVIKSTIKTLGHDDISLIGITRKVEKIVDANWSTTKGKKGIMLEGFAYIFNPKDLKIIFNKKEKKLKILLKEYNANYYIKNREKILAKRKEKYNKSKN